ncbi:MAG: hypothetical protein ACRDN6_09930 [Gaiellaceae bacterium]
MRTAIALALVTALALGADATAKRWAEQVEVCGASGCAHVEGESASRIARLAKTLEGWGKPVWRQEPRPSPFYRVVVDRGSRRQWAFLYVPSARALRIDDPDDAAPSFWRTGAPALRAALAGIAADVAPYRRSKYPST